MESKKHFDFLASFVLMILGAYVIITGYDIYRDAQELFYVSPGFFPIMLGILLVFCSVLLLVSSLKNGGAKARFAELRLWWAGSVRAKDTFVTLGGVLIMFVYTFLLLRFMPFWLASLIFLVAIMFYLRTTKALRILIISALTMGAIVVFFQVGFGIPLP
jgi:hypothetical protein